MLYNITMIYDGERLDYLECKDLRIIQDKKGYTFTTDAVLLANYVKAYAKETLVDLGTGSGVIPILCSHKTTAKQIFGIEIQPRLADMAKRSVELNNLQERIKIINDDMQNALKYFEAGSVDVISSNPPYMRFEGDKNTASEDDVCKREVCINLEQLVAIATKLLKFGGRFYMVHTADRLTDILYTLRKYDLEPKHIVTVQPKQSKNIDTVIIEAKKSAKTGSLIINNLVVCTEDGKYTKEADRIYNKDKDNG